jgi:hypothetical protein
VTSVHMFGVRCCVFPSVYGVTGDIPFLSQAFDGSSSSSDFTTLDGTARLV